MIQIANKMKSNLNENRYNPDTNEGVIKGDYSCYNKHFDLFGEVKDKVLGLLD